MRHLTPAQAAAALRRGKPVEQLLQSEPHDGQPTVKWLSVNAVRDGGFVVSAHHVYDVERHAEAEGAIEAASDHGALSDRWVNFDMVADEYADRGVS